MDGRSFDDRFHHRISCFVSRHVIVTAVKTYMMLGQRVVEVGCGVGLLALALQRIGKAACVFATDCFQNVLGIYILDESNLVL